MITRVVRSALPIDLGPTLAPLRHGRYDPTMRIDASGVWRAVRTPDGAATTRFSGGGHEVVLDAWGEGATWVCEHADDLVGASDSLGGFTPADPIVRELHRRRPGLRVARSRCVHPLLVATVIGQRVTGIQHARSWASVVRRFGERAPGPAGLWLAPSAHQLAALPYYRLHPSGIEQGRADTIRRASVVAAALERAVDSPPVLDARLRSISGIGPWTSALVCAGAAGDPDAVPVGDLHLPGIVCLTLSGDHRGGDDRMLELLEPYAGHRGRVVRLCVAGGVAPPRRAPRRALVPIADL